MKRSVNVKCSYCFTSEGSLEVDLGLAVEILHAGWPAARQEDVLLLMPRSCVVNRPLALLVQVRHSCRDNTKKWALLLILHHLCCFIYLQWIVSHAIMAAPEEQRSTQSVDVAQKNSISLTNLGLRAAKLVEVVTRNGH